VIEVERQIFKRQFSKGTKAMLSRRNILATAAVGAVPAATARAAPSAIPIKPPRDAVNRTNLKALPTRGLDNGDSSEYNTSLVTLGLMRQTAPDSPEQLNTKGYVS
jgi:hypothetical protein